MNAEVFAEWLNRQGHHVVKTASSYWFDQGPRVYQAFPYHHTIEPVEEELTRFLRDHSAIGLRYSTPLKARTGSISYHAVYEDSTYDLENLDRRSRQNIRRGLKNCVVEPISFERLADEGWTLEVDTLNRQGRQSRISQQAWQNRCLSAGALPGFEAWGAIVKNRLGASLLAFQMDDCCTLLYKQCSRQCLSLRINNALSFVVTQTMVKRPEIRNILYGLHSLDAPPNIDEFKFRMGYKAKPVRQRVVFHPWLSPILNRYIHAAVKQLLNRYQISPTLAKAEGMLRFYLEGKHPLEQQCWPEVLLKQ
jgi:hypothetical protein